MSSRRNVLLLTTALMAGCTAEQAPLPAFPSPAKTTTTVPATPQPLAKKHIVNEPKQPTGSQRFVLPSGEVCFTDMNHTIEGGRVVRAAGKLGATACEVNTRLPKDQIPAGYPEGLASLRTKWKAMTREAEIRLNSPVNEHALIEPVDHARVTVIGEQRVWSQAGNAEYYFWLGQDADTPYGPTGEMATCSLVPDRSVVEVTGPVSYNDDEYQVGIVRNRDNGALCTAGQIVILQTIGTPHIPHVS